MRHWQTEKKNLKEKSVFCSLSISWNSEGQRPLLGASATGVRYTATLPDTGEIRSDVCPAWYHHLQNTGAAAKSLQSCPTLCNPIDGSLPGSPVPGILQARTLEWVAISFSNAWKWKVKVKSLNRVRLLATPGTAAYQAPLSMGFSRQEYWSGLPLPSPKNLPKSEIWEVLKQRFNFNLHILQYNVGL